MASENEPAKLLLPYLQRADELQKHEPLVAYYCRLYAMEQGMRIPQKERTKTTNSLLVSLMKQLEKDKKSLTLGPDDNLHVEGFASTVFAKADKQDRAGKSDLNTAKTFYAASIFFEILNQFGEPQPDLEQKQKYAVWKAADIRKALKEGRKPLPGPPGGDQDTSMLSSTSSGEYDVEPNTSDISNKPDPSRVDPSTMQDSFSPHQPYRQDSFQHTSISPQHSGVPPSTSSSMSPPLRYQTDEYPSDNFHQPPPTNNSDHSAYQNSDRSVYHQQSYQQPPYQPEPHQNFPQHYTQHDVPSVLPNFQSYPSFSESSLPTAPSHYVSHYQGPDSSSFVDSPPPNPPSYPAPVQYNSSGRNGGISEISPPSTHKYEYDSSYMPPPEKIAEAHKAARFAVGALAFDDVSVGVEHLKKALELLTNPSAGN